MRKFVKNIIELFAEYDVYFADRKGVVYKTECNLSRNEAMDLLNKTPNCEYIVYRRLNREHIAGVACCWAMTIFGGAMMYIFG